MPQNFIETVDVQRDALKDEILRLKSQGYRLMTITAVDIDEDHVDLIYHYDKGLKLANLRLKQPKKENAPSISDVDFAAFLVENEIQDQFGICFEGLALNFANHLYLDEEVAVTPFCKYGVTRKDAS